MQIDVQDRPERNRYEVTADGEHAGMLRYRLGDGTISFTHAEVDDAYGGKGVGSRLAAYALDDARSRGLAVLPDCPFVSAYVDKHREYAELVPTDARARYGLDD